MTFAVLEAGEGLNDNICFARTQNRQIGSVSIEGALVDLEVVFDIACAKDGLSI
jgi:hypothetical protein